MSRLLVSVGCNHYATLASLSGAENDASRVYNTLTSELGQYDAESSALLLSPSREEFRATLAAILSTRESIDSFTLYFAGHGAVRAGSFFFCMKDTNPSLFSGTAFSLSETFIMLGESAPAQTNIIIDACESGGLIADLHALLKPELIGESGTPAITLLATAAKDQYANESSQGGVGTEAILKCVTGDTFVTDASPALDLIDIGRHISEASGDTDQTPVVWGLNLYGPRRFCVNPNYAGEHAALRNVGEDLSDSGDRATLKGMTASLWRRHLVTEGRWDSRRFHDDLVDVLAFLNARDVDVRPYIERTFYAATELFSVQQDPFLALEVGAACLVSSLPFLRDDEKLARSMEIAVGALADGSGRAFDLLFAQLTEDKNRILSRRSGPADLFYLPIRLSRLLGWAALLDTVVASGLTEKAREPTLPPLLDLFSEHYPLSLRAMSDVQAPFLALALAVAIQLGVPDRAEICASLIFHDMVTCGGKVADPHLGGEDAFRYLYQRASGEWRAKPDQIAQPSTLALVLILFGRQLGLADVFDDSLHLLDHLWISTFIPDDYADFGLQVISEGRNLNYKIGHDVWTTADLEAAWPEAVSRSPQPRVLSILVILASLVFPDRVPPFLFPKGKAQIAQEGLKSEP